MFLERRCKKCQLPVEPDRPKQSQYCKACGANRSRDWKQEHPEKSKLYDSVVAARDWRAKHDWNKYIQNWRLDHHEAYRKQNRLHLQTHRSFRKRKLLLRVLVLLLLVTSGVAAATTHGLAVSWEPEKLNAALDFYDHLLIKATVAVGLTFFCIRTILFESREVTQNFRIKNGNRTRKKRRRGVKRHSRRLR